MDQNGRFPWFWHASMSCLNTFEHLEVPLLHLLVFGVWYVDWGPDNLPSLEYLLGSEKTEVGSALIVLIVEFMLQDLKWIWCLCLMRFVLNDSINKKYINNHKHTPCLSILMPDCMSRQKILSTQFCCLHPDHSSHCLRKLTCSIRSAGILAAHEKWFYFSQ